MVKKTEEKMVDKKNSMERDEYASLAMPASDVIKEAIMNFQEEAKGRQIDYAGIEIHTRYGRIVTTDDKGIAEAKATGKEVDNRGEMHEQRFFIGLNGASSCLEPCEVSVNLVGPKETSARNFEVKSLIYKSLDAVIKNAQKKGEKKQKKIDEELEKFYGFVHQEPIIKNYPVEQKEHLSIDDQINLVAVAKAKLKKILGSKLKTDDVAIFDLTDTLVIADNDGVVKDGIVPRVGITIQVETEDGSKAFKAIRGSMGGMEILKDGKEGSTYEEIVAALAEEAAYEVLDLDRAQSRSILGDKCPVILSSEVAGVLAHEVYGHCSEADIIRENIGADNKINLKGRIGAQISENSNFSMIDSSNTQLHFGKRTFNYAWGALPFDDHGTDAKETVVVDKGIFKVPLIDRWSFNEIIDGLSDPVKDEIVKHGLTCNSRRESWNSVSQVRMTNTCILPDENGPKNIEEMCKILPKNKKGVFVASAKGGFVETNTGLFQVSGALAYLIENGEVTNKPISDVSITGNVATFGAKIKSIGSSESITKMFTGYCGKNGQWVPAGGVGPLLYIEDCKIVSANRRYWYERALKEYMKQVKEVNEGKRTKNNIYIREIEDSTEGKVKEHTHICMVTANFDSIKSEIDFWLEPSKRHGTHEVVNGELVEVKKDR